MKIAFNPTYVVEFLSSCNKIILTMTMEFLNNIILSDDDEFLDNFTAIFY